jgi:PAS domain S-box-containing protein
MANPSDHNPPSVPPWVNSMGAPVWITDAAGTISYLNSRAEKLFGRTLSEWAGRPCHECIRGHSEEGIVCGPRCMARRHAAARQEIEPVRMRLAAAEERGEVSVVVIAVERDGGPELVHMIVDDERERRLRRFLDGVIQRSDGRPGSRAASTFDLTAREEEVLRLLAADLSLHEIAARLSVSYTTIRTHVQHVLGKLGVHSILEAVAVWVVAGGPRRD